MKKIFAIFFSVLLLAVASSNAQIKIGSPAGAANASAVLDLSNTGAANRGLLLPSIALTSTSVAAPIAAHVAGMVVYNTATAGSGATAVTPGVYVNDGTKWKPLNGAVVVSDAIYSALSTSQSSYTAAAIDTWVNVTAAEYANVAATVSGTSAYGEPNSVFSPARNSGNFGNGLTLGANTGSAATFPAGNYPIAMKWTTHITAGAGSGITSQLKFGTSASAGYVNYIGLTTGITTAADGTYYFVIRQPSTAQASAAVVGSYISTIPIGLGGVALNGVTTYRATGNATGTLGISDANGYHPLLQVLGTATKSW